jgi:hypothetical protein
MCCAWPQRWCWLAQSELVGARRRERSGPHSKEESGVMNRGAKKRNVYEWIYAKQNHRNTMIKLHARLTCASTTSPSAEPHPSPDSHPESEPEPEPESESESVTPGESRTNRTGEQFCLACLDAFLRWRRTRPPPLYDFLPYPRDMSHALIGRGQLTLTRPHASSHACDVLLTAILRPDALAHSHLINISRSRSG